MTLAYILIATLFFTTTLVIWGLYDVISFCLAAQDDLKMHHEAIGELLEHCNDLNHQIKVLQVRTEMEPGKYRMFEVLDSDDLEKVIRAAKAIEEEIEGSK